MLRNQGNLGQNTGPNPERFKDFDVIDDETGFTVKGSDHIFYFDRHGGWFDEYKNYYNADGVPKTPPDSSNFTDDDYDPADEWVNEYEDGYDDDAGDGQDNLDLIFQNNKNIARVDTYDKDADVEIECDMSWNIKQSDFEAFLHQNKINFKGVNFYQNDKGKFKGTALIVLDKANAKTFCGLNGNLY